MAHKIGGIAQILVGGTTIECSGEFSWNVGGPEREDADGVNGLAGYIERNAGRPSIEGDIYAQAIPDISALVRGDGVVIQLDLMDGQGTRIVLTDAWYSGESQVDQMTGKLAAKWSGKRIEVVT